MELWFTEDHTSDVRFSMKVKEHIYTKQSEFQQIDIFDTKEFGKVLTLDGFLMVTEKDEFIYHDMITHVAMATNPNIKKVLVIGAGDGGTIRELLRYDTMEYIDMVEIDEEVVIACEKHLPLTANQLRNQKVHLYFEDGLRYVRKVENEYDLIIVDSTDPFGPGEGLFTKEFYGNCYRALKDDGILINQHESVYYASYEQAMKRAHDRIRSTFPVARVFQAHIPTYPSGHWLFGFASKKYDPILDFDGDKWEQLGLKTKYYNKELHKGAFAIPTYVKEILERE